MLRKDKLTKKALRTGLTIGMLLLSFAFVAPPAAAACGDPLDVQVDQDACATVVAVSATGDATGTVCRGVVSCIAVSGTGDATNNAGYVSCGYNGAGAAGCLAISITGDATNNAKGYSCGANYQYVPLLYRPYLTGTKLPSAGCVAVSGTGSASNTAYYRSCGQDNGVGCVAVSGLGAASNQATDESCGVVGDPFILVGVGCIAVSGTGTATNSATWESCGVSRPSNAYGTVAAGCIAVSGGGLSENRVTGRHACGWNDGISVAAGCFAVSGAGDASNSGTSTVDWQGKQESPCGAGWVPQYEGGVGVSCIAVSLAGSGSNTVDGGPCATYAGAFGNSEAVRCVSVGAGALASGITPTLSLDALRDTLPAEEAVASTPGLVPAAPAAIVATAPTSHGLASETGTGEIEESEAVPTPSWWESIFAVVASWVQILFGGVE